MKQQSSSRLSIGWVLLIALGITFVVVLSYLIYRVGSSNRTLISITMLPILAGLVYENRRLGSSWESIGLKSAGAFFISLFAFLPGKNEATYLLDNHLQGWPYWFIGGLVLISMVVHKEHIVPKLTEGITLLQSIAIIYWLIDLKALSFDSPYSIALMIIGLPFVLYSFLHAFTRIELTPTTKLTLSIWSSVIMLAFAVDHVIRVIMLESLEQYELFDQFVVVIQYFLFGIALMYILQNLFMLLVYLPRRSKHQKANRRKEIRKTNVLQIKRFSSQQISILDAFLAIIVVSGAFYLNYQYQIFPRHTAIWLMFMVFPMLIWAKEMVVNGRGR